MISKELMSEVLDEVCPIVEVKEWKNNDLMIRYSNKVQNHINIYELAHKCKEWAKLKHFIDIDSHCGCARWGAEATRHNGSNCVFYEQVFIGRNEQEAIFKACEWILENR